MKRNALIDLFRFVCAFLVVVIHIPFPGGVFHGFVFPLTRMVVPFFFMVSGYFLADENAGRMKRRLNKQIRHIVWLFAGSMLIYFIVRILFIIMQDPSGTPGNLLVLLDWNSWLRLLAINDTAGFPAGHLWYLSALLYAMVVIRRALEHFELKKLYWPALILGLLLVPLLVWQKSPQAANVPLSLVRNYLFFGFPCLMAGAWLKCNAQRILTWPRKFVMILPVVFALLAIGERWLVYSWLGFGSMVTFFNALLLAASLIVLSVHFPAAGARTVFPQWGARYSLMIYIIHIIPLRVLDAAAGAWGCREASWYRWSAPIVVFLLAFGFAVLWEGAMSKLKERKQAKATVS